MFIDVITLSRDRYKYQYVIYINYRNPYVAQLQEFKLFIGVIITRI